MEEALEFHIKVSYFEIYMDKIRDLLDGECVCVCVCVFSVDDDDDCGGDYFYMEILLSYHMFFVLMLVIV